MANVGNKIKKDLKDLIASKTTQREQILDLLSLKDVIIDEMDALIINIDSNLPALFDEINDEIDKVKAAYDARITAGCRSALYWRDDGEVDYGADGAKQWTVALNPATRIDYGYHSLKYYQYPRNRDYGSSLIAQFDGNVVGGGLTIAVTTGVVSLSEGEEVIESTEPDYKSIKVGDEITDALVRPEIFQTGNLPSVVAIGYTDTLSGVTTSVVGTVSVGSTILFNLGIGNTIGTPVGSGVGLTSILHPDTTVYGHGTASHNFTKVTLSGGNQILTQVTETVPTIILNRPAIGTATTERFSVGIKTNVTALTLSTSAGIDAYNQEFYAIRTATEPDENFRVTTNPLDPVSVGNINSSNLGIGHSVHYVNASSPYTTYPTGPFKWREVFQDPEPQQGGGAAVYSSGNQSWPCTLDSDGDPVLYPTEGTIRISAYQPSTTSESPGPQTPGNSTCDALDAAITAAEAARDVVIAKNEPIIRGYVAQTKALRALRDDQEIEAWGLLQSSAYMKQEVERLTAHLSDLEAQTLPDIDM